MCRRAGDDIFMSECLTLRKAITRFVRPGATIALEGFTHLIPFAADVTETPPPSSAELEALRDLHVRTARDVRTARAHGTAPSDF